MVKVIAVIPARGGSKRLKGKNIRPIAGKPMLSYAINACKKSEYVGDVFVSTEDKEIKEVALEYGAEIIDRPARLAEDNIKTQDVFKHAAEEKDFDILVSVQANSPTVNPDNIDKAINLMLENGLWEVRSVTSEGLEHGAVWALKRDTIFWDGLSVYFGVVVDDAIDIHNKEDLKLAEKVLQNDKD